MKHSEVIPQYNSNFDIPNLIKVKLDHDPELYTKLLDVSTQIYRFVKDYHNKFFFNDFTDHGPHHFEFTLHTAVNLMTPHAIKYFSSADACALCLSCLIHDIGMHFTYDNFVGLVSESYSNLPLLLSTDQRWDVLWQNYLLEINQSNSLYNSSSICNLIQDDTLSCCNDGVNVHLLDPEKNVIGEFLRRHHSTLAHYVAVYGIPHYNKMPSELCCNSSNDKFMHLIGFIARSHGMPLDHCHNYLSLSSPFLMKGAKTLLNTHPMYLVILLRLADFLQIQSGRASAFFEYNIKNKISLQEHSLHKAYVSHSTEHDDPEVIKIEFTNTNVTTVIRIKNYIDCLQNELNDCWAWLGIEYGRFNELRKLDLKFRRVITDFDNVDYFKDEKGDEYYMKQMAFTIKKEKLLSLLIRPFYGNKPYIGIRELLQNSIDAVREKDHYKSHCSELYPMYNMSNDVTIILDIESCIDSEKKWITGSKALLVISDNGIGMNEDVIENFFLVAGSSNRQSSNWKKLYVSINDDNAPYVSLLKAGRFGLGVLATFLLSDSFTVITRRIGMKYGLCFTINLQDESLCFLKKEISSSYGTQISLYTDPQFVIDAFRRFDWYCLSYPQVQVAIRYRPNTRLLYSSLRDEYFDFDENGLCVYKQKTCIPEKPEGIDNVGFWRKVKNTNGMISYWHVPRDNKYISAPFIAVSGMKIRDRKHTEEILFDDYGVRFFVPCLSILDYDAQLPVSLDRTNVDTSSVLFVDLIKDMAKVLIAMLLTLSDTSAYEILGYGESYKLYSNKSEYKLFYVRLCANKDGFFPYSPSLIQFLHIREVVYIIISTFGKSVKLLEKYEKEIEYLLTKDATVSVSLVQTSNRSDETDEFKYDRIEMIPRLHGKGEKSIYITNYDDRDEVEDFVDITERRLPFIGLRCYHLFDNIFRMEETTLFGKGIKWDEWDEENAKSVFKNSPYKPTYVRTLLDYSDWSEPESIFFQEWKRLLGKTPIPFKRKDREKVFSAAFQELSPIIRMLEQLRL